jgi:hypothetical protein
MKTLILGTIAGMSLDQIKPFFLSLEKVGHRGDLCVLVSDVDCPTLKFLQARHINLVPFQNAYLDPASWLARFSRMFLARQPQLRLKEQFALSYLHRQCARYFYYRSYLANCGSNYDHVMLADIRDILFQRDPFDFNIPDGLSVFMEDPGKTIGTCFTNSSWIRNCFGDAVLKELHHQPISCSGITIGTIPSVLDYLDRMVSILCTYKKRTNTDQAAHNFLIYKRTPKALHRFDNDSGTILTMANVDPSCFRINDQGLLINGSGRLFNTLHQYDRHPELSKHLLAVLT